MSDAGSDDSGGLPDFSSDSGGGDSSGASWNIVPSMDVQADTANSLIQSMAASNLTQTPSLPIDTGGGGAVAGLLKQLSADTGNSANAKANQSIVTRAIANQGQLLPIAAPQSSSTSSGDQTKKILDAIQSLSANSSSSGSSGSSSSSGGGGGGVGDVLGAIGDVASALAWIICTELYKQKKMPARFYIAGGSTFAAYSEIGKRGYYLWAIPCVHHLRAHPNSLFSKFLELIFLWRAENIAARKGVRGANWTIRGAFVTAVLYPSCHVIGFILYLLGKDMNWMQVYGEKT